MTWKWFLVLASSLFWTTFLAAQEIPKSKADEDKTQDAAVLEVVLVDLLSNPDSMSGWNKETKKEIYFSTDVPSHGTQALEAAEILRPSDDKKLEKLSADQLVSRREAAEHLVQRVGNKDVFKDFVPRDKRVRMYSKEEREKDEQRDFFNRLNDVFSAYSPGYSRNRELAIVHLSFRWSIHGAVGTYVLTKKKDGWIILLSDFIFFL